MREFIGGLLEAMPDLRFELLATATEADRCAVQWKLTGTFVGPASFNGIEPTGSPIALEGIDLITVRNGLIQSNDAFSDSMTFARQAGLMPPQGSVAERRLTGAFNVKTRLGRRLAGEAGAERVADRVWLVQGAPAHCNVYLIEDAGGITLFDAGARTMAQRGLAPRLMPGGVRRRSFWAVATLTVGVALCRSTCPSCAIQRRSRTPRAAVAFATGAADCPMSPRPTDSCTGSCTAIPGTAAR